MMENRKANFKEGGYAWTLFKGNPFKFLIDHIEKRVVRGGIQVVLYSRKDYRWGALPNYLVFDSRQCYETLDELESETKK